MTTILDLFWRVVLAIFGWVPERFLPWWRQKVSGPTIHRWRVWQCRNGHIAERRVSVPVALYSPKRTAIIQRKIACGNCGAMLHATWKGRMNDKRRRDIAWLIPARCPPEEFEP